MAARRDIHRITIHFIKDENPPFKMIPGVVELLAVAQAREQGLVVEQRKNYSETYVVMSGTVQSNLDDFVTDREVHMKNTEPIA